tara:strand:+ start:692 stop:1195 length:504 start_codon:yes stop_codon:yes gene_type:complete
MVLHSKFLKSKEVLWLNNKKFFLDKNSKTITFFNKNNYKNYTFIDKDILKKLIKISKKYKINFRLNLHKSSKDKFHDMIIVSRKGASGDIHLHKKFYTTYHLLIGKVVFFFYDKNIKQVKKIVMNNKKIKIIRVSPKVFRSHTTLSDFAIFHEIRKGPYNRSDIIKK